MFKHLLVPLDGSHLAESILPVARTFALALHAPVTLLHVVEPTAPATVHGDTHLMTAPDAQAYLDRIADQLRVAGIPVDTHVDVVVGDVAKAIFQHGGELNADLILLTNHGHSGLKQALFGSIAQQVLQSGAIPVLLVKAETPIPEASYTCTRILVPLDSSPLYETALEVSVDLARAFSAALHLVVVVPTMQTLSPERAATGILLPSSTRAMLDLAESGAEEYLEKKIEQLGTGGISVSGQVLRGDVPTQIIMAEQQSEADLIVMATHGRAGLDAFWSGSIAPKVLSRAHAPTLLLRVAGPEPVR
ncbi:MAG TPA: universal stress protein [Anaerolineae bacterium]|nr:universal stress protein [Anaerolineae bacterium]